MNCKRFRIEDLRNEEWFQFYKRFKKLVEQYDAEALNIVELFDVFLRLFADADEAMVIIRKSATTEKIADADHARDVIFRGLVDSTLSDLNHFDEAKREAAKRLKIVFDQYGNLARKTYEEETASIYNMLQDLHEHYADDIEMLGLGDWVAKLESDNQTFEDLMETRFSEGAEKTELRMVQIRKATDRNYRDILNRLDSAILFNGAEQYAPFVKELNVRVERAADTLAQRKGVNAKKKDSET